METAIGLLSPRDRAGETRKELRPNVPDESIVSLTRSENSGCESQKGICRHRRWGLPGAAAFDTILFNL
jgi:hypothetical protein